MNDWEVLHCPWYLESNGWKQAFDDNERTQFWRIAAREQPKTLFLSVKEGNEVEAAKSSFQVDAIADVHPSYADKSRKGRSKEKAASTLKPATSKRSKFPSVFCFLLKLNFSASANVTAPSNVMLSTKDLSVIMLAPALMSHSLKVMSSHLANNCSSQR
jgi:hypothetical protein